MKRAQSKQQKYLIPLLALIVSGVILSLLLSERLKKGHCNKSSDKLCKEPETVNIDGIEYKTCKNAKLLDSHGYSDYLKYTIIPLVAFIIIVSIIFLTYRILSKKDNIKSNLVYILPIVFGILINLILIWIYYIFRNNCMDNKYYCQLESELIINDELLGHTEYKCKSKLPNRANISYLITHKFNHVIYSILIFILLIAIYVFEDQFDILNLKNKKFTDKINILVYGFISLLLFIINLLFPNTYLQYLFNSIVALIFILLLIILKYVKL